MREKELREVAKCIGCGKAFGHTGLPLFWRVTIERYGVDMKAINRQQGLTMMLGGNALLAQVMGADEEMATCLSSQKVTLCEECAMKEHNLFVLSEKAAEQSVQRTGCPVCKESLDKDGWCVRCGEYPFETANR